MKLKIKQEAKLSLG